MRTAPAATLTVRSPARLLVHWRVRRAATAQSPSRGEAGVETPRPSSQTRLGALSIATDVVSPGITSTIITRDYELPIGGFFKNSAASIHRPSGFMFVTFEVVHQVMWSVVPLHEVECSRPFPATPRALSDDWNVNDACCGTFLVMWLSTGETTCLKKLQLFAERSDENYTVLNG